MCMLSSFLFSIFVKFRRNLARKPFMKTVQCRVVELNMNVCRPCVMYGIVYVNSNSHLRSFRLIIQSRQSWYQMNAHMQLYIGTQ